MKRNAFLTPMPKRPKTQQKFNTCPDSTSRDSVSVFCRIRPPDDSSDDNFVEAVDSRTIKLIPPVSAFAFRNGSAKEQHFKFKKVFPSETAQKEIFDTIAKPLISDVLCGKNALLFVYGITGSGKTYTMEGTRQEPGMLRRAIKIIFASISDLQTIKYVFKPDRMNGFEVQSVAEAMLDRQKFDVYGRPRRANRKDQSSVSNSLTSLEDSSKIASLDEDNGYAVFVSYIEIYNNYVYDLLEEFATNNMTKELQSKILREDGKHNMYVHGCSEVEVKTPEEAFEVLMKGQKRRKVAYTKLNLESSRSHSIFTFRVVQAPYDAQGEELLLDKSSVVVSQFSMVDLAGSERNSRTRATGDRIKEAGNINNSLMVLRQCIETLRENQLYKISKKVPYRDSKLTHFFKNYFEGEGRINMVVCINPRPDDYDETLPVMKFTELASEVEVLLPSSVVRPDHGLPTGRRRAHQVLKAARRCIADEPKTNRECDVENTVPIYSLGPSWPPLNISPSSSMVDVRNGLEKLLGFLEKRSVIKQKFVQGIKDEEFESRKELVEMEKDTVVLRQENASYKSLYDNSMKKLKFMEGRLMNAELANDSLHRKFADYNNLIDEHRQACEERDMVKAQGQIEKQKIKSRFKSRYELEREKMIKDMNNKLMEQKSQLKMKIYENQVKALQEMFDYPGNGAPPPTPKRQIHSSSSEENISTPRKAVVEPTPCSSRHRRSYSQGANVGQMWIDHRPDEVVTPRTLLQSNMPHAKSVRRLRSSDLLDSKRVSNYCLTTHKLDKSGDVETKMYKADVVPTTMGGAQVVFNDVEILTQKDVLELSGGKRDADGQPKVDSQALQTRCAAAIANNAKYAPSKRAKK